jgi:hypothetical protein
VGVGQEGLVPIDGVKPLRRGEYRRCYGFGKFRRDVETAEGEGEVCELHVAGCEGCGEAVDGVVEVVGAG